MILLRANETVLHFEVNDPLTPGALHRHARSLLLTALFSFPTQSARRLHSSPFVAIWQIHVGIAEIH